MTNERAPGEMVRMTALPEWPIPYAPVPRWWVAAATAGTMRSAGHPFSVIARALERSSPELARRYVHLYEGVLKCAEDVPELTADTPLSQLGQASGVDVRLLNCLRNDNIETLREASRRTRAEFLQIPNFGKRCLTEMNRLLDYVGLATR